jgi:hypothetical protein
MGEIGIVHASVQGNVLKQGHQRKQKVGFLLPAEMPTVIERPAFEISMTMTATT